MMLQSAKTMIYRIFGVVQGVGFRPFVHRMASQYGIAGQVINKGSYVEVIAQGTPEALQKFKTALRSEAPARSNIIQLEEMPVDWPVMQDFVIAESQADSGEIFIPPDIAICPECRRELFDPQDRRYLHAFNNCTACGPRSTILESLPYDRERTSMKKFPMCKACASEYNDLASRRYDAQPVCCNECGPEVFILDSTLHNHAAITQVRQLIMAGQVAAIKGIGGFHLACDGRNAEAIERLRRLKHRPRKPFAVMMRDLATVRRECVLTAECEKWLDGSEKPILLLDKQSRSTLPETLAPGNPTLGVMLPYAPLHCLLFDLPDGVDFTDTLVMTSGNCAGAPICRSAEDARQEIGTFCDVILSHNRDIRLRADDSVMSCFENKPYMIRRSRGFAPLPLRLGNCPKGSVLAIGAELKNAFCIVRNDLAYLAPHLGDMEDVRTLDALKESIKLFTQMLECRVERVVCDMHPKYHTTALAESLELPLLKVQHHYAHILSCMAENSCYEPVIGVAMDGTGYGSDGTIWGGEILLASPESFERWGHIDTFPQAGGDAAAREGWRIAAGLLHKLYPEQGESYVEKLSLCSPVEYRVLSNMIEKNINCIASSSAGRLFDAVSAVLGITGSSTFEGDAAMSLEFAARHWRKTHNLSINDDTVWPEELTAGKAVLPTDTLFEYILMERLNGADINQLAWNFHRALGTMIVNSCELAREQSGINICALSGGTFQNQLLLECCVKELRSRNFKVLLHSLVPPNDGGISLGQAAAGKYQKI